jgi:superfamily II DNA or RNA helicase
LLAEDVPATGLRTDAQFDVLPYQLEPALAFLHGFGTRVLIGDDVGLGKTMEGLIAAAELRRRGVVRRVLIVCPAGLREQWAEECTRRFGMQPAIFDQQGIRRRRAETSALVNPWTTEPLGIVSVDFIKRPEVLPAALSGRWDLVVVDEAHGVCGDSDRHAAMAELTARAVFVILLTATPHNGDEAAFTSLCRLGQLDDDRLVVFRRSRADVGRDVQRRIQTLRVRSTAAERRMQLLLSRLTALVKGEGQERKRDVWLLLSLLHKRSLSSAFALAQSAERRLDALTDVEETPEHQLLLPLDDGSGENDEGDAPPMWSVPMLHDRRQERHLFEELRDAARAAQDGDAKLARLCRLVDAVREPAIVFTEYRDTLVYVQRRLNRAAAVLHGGMSRDQRREALRQFEERGLLLATDAAGEGLNLHHRCRLIVNLELPWNPMRLEQRIGRVDRIGQRRRVHVIHMIGADTGELLLLERLTQRVARARATMQAANPLGGMPAWTEEDSARLIVLREPVEGVGAAAEGPAVSTTRLAADGEREAQRIVWRRQLLAVDDSGTLPDPAEPASQRRVMTRDGPLAAVTGRWRTRARLGQRALVVCRSTIEDPAQRIVSTRVDAVMALPGATDRAERDGGWLRTVAETPRLVEWQRASIDAHRRFMEMVAKRAASIAMHLRVSRRSNQPGLFDRRFERAWEQAAADEQSAVAAGYDLQAEAVRAADAVLNGPVPALVLTPRQ